MGQGKSGWDFNLFLHQSAFLFFFFSFGRKHSLQVSLEFLSSKESSLINQTDGPKMSFLALRHIRFLDDLIQKTHWLIVIISLSGHWDRAQVMVSQLGSSMNNLCMVQNEGRNWPANSQEGSSSSRSWFSKHMPKKIMPREEVFKTQPACILLFHRILMLLNVSTRTTQADLCKYHPFTEEEG